MRGKISSCLESGLTSHEGDTINDKVIDILTKESCELSEKIVVDFNELFKILFIDTEKMLSNLMMTEDYIASENLMLELAKYIGRNESHKLIHSLINSALEKNLSIKNSLIRNTRQSN